MSLFNTNKQPKSVDDCLKKDDLIQNLNSFTQRLYTFSIVAVVVVVILGIFNSISSARQPNIYSDVEFNWLLFFTSFMTYCIYAALLSGFLRITIWIFDVLTGIYEQTRITARLKEYELRLTSDSITDPVTGKATVDGWKCRGCGRIHKAYETSCVCGQKHSEN